MSRLHLFSLAALTLLVVSCTEGTVTIETGTDEGLGLDSLDTRRQELPSEESVTGYRFPWTSGAEIRVTQSPHAYRDNIWNAIDFGLGFGSDVRAMRGGVISAFVDNNADMSLEKDCVESSCNKNTNYLIIQHDDGNESVYFHLKQGSISGLGLGVGSQICQGQVVAQIGHNGYTTGPHVHVSVEAGGSNGWSEIWSRKTKVIHFDELSGPVASGQKYVSANAENCTGEAVDIPDRPFCSGRLSGYWCEGDELVLCSNGSEANRDACLAGCKQMSYGTPDECEAVSADPAPAPTPAPEPDPQPEPDPSPDPAPDPSPNNPCQDKLDGHWCDGADLIVCQNDSEQSRSTCDTGCESMPVGTADRCYSDVCQGKLNGYWCDGGDDLVLCQSDRVAAREACANGCNSQPVGFNDFCN